MSISLSLTISYHSLFMCFTFIPITLIYCDQFTWSRQFLPSTHIRFGKASLITYFSVELSCLKALHINFSKRMLSWTDLIADWNKRCDYFTMSLPWNISWTFNAFLQATLFKTIETVQWGIIRRTKVLLIKLVFIHKIAMTEVGYE